jgi:hypothetical protein
VKRAIRSPYVWFRERLSRLRQAWRTECEGTLREHQSGHARSVVFGRFHLLARLFVPAASCLCPALPSSLLDGKEGVDGSESSEGFTKGQQMAFFLARRPCARRSVARKLSPRPVPSIDATADSRLDGPVSAHALTTHLARRDAQADWLLVRRKGQRGSSTPRTRVVASSNSTRAAAHKRA